VRNEPPKSEPSASGTSAAASAAAPPPVEPLADMRRSQGLRVAPNTRLTVLPPAANSGVFVLPMTTQPARLSLTTVSPSSSGTWSA
jgi:hypothetical protein